ncbi:transcriptional regulator [Nordella sp. HKS 07]|uniref:transcriptional regulator n=1 Tax=Nordella sp. HKS 07 TaxID=2712222 RepID=UPI0013E1B205|nr:transcriptional regulator [Nordella sp. HKS 07]QIG49665.1 transcriptional regulator [Nordella sp. HKS 07]
MMKVYRFTESGLDSVIIAAARFLVDPIINGLHRVIALGIVMLKALIGGRVVRVLRFDIGTTQADLARMIHCDPLTICRWERGESEIVVRLHGVEWLKLPGDEGVSEISGWAISQA